MDVTQNNLVEPQKDKSTVSHEVEGCSNFQQKKNPDPEQQAEKTAPK